MATNILETMSTSASSGDGSVRLNEVAKHLDQVTLEPRGHDVPNPTVPTQLEVALHGGDTIYEDEEPQTQLDASASLEIEQSFNFLGLPRELREIVYEFALVNPNGLLLVDGVQREPTKANRERIKDRKCTTYDALEQEVFLFWSFQDLSQLTDRYCEAWYSVLSDTPYVPNWKLLQSNSQIRKDATEVLFKKNQIRLLSIRAARPFFFDAGLNRNFIRDLYMKVPVVGRWGQKVQVPSHYDSLFRYMASGMLPGLKILTIAICDGLLRWRWDENLTSTHLAYPLVSQLGTIQNLEKLTVECQHFTPPTEVVAVDLERDIEVYLTCMMCGVDVLNSSDEDTANRARAMGSLLEPEVEDSEEEDDEYACHEAY